MAADFEVTSILADDSARGVISNVKPNGDQFQSKCLLGADGAGATGKGGWWRVDFRDATFMVYNQSHKGAVNGTVDVRVEACMELAQAPDDPVADTKVYQLAALTAAAPVTAVSHPWRYVRARVEAFGGAVNVQVGAHVYG